MQEAYFISGLGADQRLFSMQFKEGIPLKVISWKRPAKGESLEDYAKRMAADIPKDKPVIIGGVSFGGMIALEVSKHVNAEKIILISSIKSYKELPFRIKIWKYIPIYKLVTGRLVKRMGIVFKFIFGKMSGNQTRIFEEMVIDSDEEFISWAIRTIVNWNKEYDFKNIVHIHGTNDLIFPIGRLNEPVIKIPKGSHIMVVTMADRIN